VDILIGFFVFDKLAWIGFQRAESTSKSAHDSTARVVFKGIFQDFFCIRQAAHLV